MKFEFEHPFDLLVQKPDGDIRIAEAALLFAADHSPGLDPKSWLERLDGLARRVERIEVVSPADQVAALRTVLVEEEGFSANITDYYDPRNSLLDQVIERRVGIPISLSVIWLDIARQLRWPFVGVGLPGHFVIKRKTPTGDLLIDPFGGGQVLSRAGCERLVSQLLGKPVQLDDSAFEAVAAKATLMRMLNNLRTVLSQQEAWSSTACVLARMLALEPDSELIRREIAMVGVRIAELN